MMAIHQHQALSVINMLFMNRLRVVRRVETLRIQHNEELKQLDRSEKEEIAGVMASAGSKPLNKKQQKTKETIEQKYVSFVVSFHTLHTIAYRDKSASIIREIV
jgi:hypothetical protein